MTGRTAVAAAGLVLTFFAAGAVGFIAHRSQGAAFLKKPAAPDNTRKLSAEPAEMPYREAGAAYRSQALAVVQYPSRKIVMGKDAFAARPAASLTKLVSAMVALDGGTDLGATIAIKSAEFDIGANLLVAPERDLVTARDLLFTSITGSANNSAEALARASGIGYREFVREMNLKAAVSGLETASFSDASGLDPRNVASPYEIAVLAAEAFTRYPEIGEAASLPRYSMKTVNTGREHTVKNPNDLFLTDPEAFDWSKTGYLNEALYCLALGKRTSGGALVAVVMGSPSKENSEREALAALGEAEALLDGADIPF